MKTMDNNLMTATEYHKYVIEECERQWNECRAEEYGEWHIQSDDTKAGYYNDMYSHLADNLGKACCDCCYLRETNEETSADRIGRRIRTIRMEKGLSRAELGEAMGLTADRIQKYENGARKPKFDMLKQFAYVLGVETIALMDPVVSNYIGAMFAFFEMEELYELEVKKDGAKYSLQFGNGFTGTMNEYLKEWYEERKTVRTRMENATEEEKETILREYHEWEKTFPIGQFANRVIFEAMHNDIRNGAKQ